MDYTKKRNLNNYGVKSSCDMWRTIKGVLYIQWASYGEIKEYQKEFPEYKFIQRGCEIFRSKDKIE